MKLLMLGVALAASIILQFTITGGTSNAVQPGPNLAFYNAHPYYTCTNNVSVTNMTQLNAALGTAFAAGTCVNVAPGLYSIGGGLTFTHGGNNGGSKTGYVVWRCTSMPFGFSGGVLQGEGSTNSCHMKGDGNAGQGGEEMFFIGANYLMFDGFEIDGNTAALSCFDNENGGAIVPHHIWLMNSTLHGCQGQSGIQTWANDWFFVIHNVWHNNSKNSAGGGGIDSCGCDGSGFSIFEPQDNPVGYTPAVGNVDYWHSNTTGLTYHFVIIDNVGFDNSNGSRAATDGNGLILDSWDTPGTFTGPSLVMGNVMFSNGGRGINVVFMRSGQGAPITVVHNSTYFNSNNTDINTTYASEFVSNRGDGITAIDNIFYAAGTANGCPDSPGNPTPPCTLIDDTSGADVNIYQSNISFPGGKTQFVNGTAATYPLSGTNKNIDGVNPKYTLLSTTAPNFVPQTGSPAIGIAEPFDLWPSSDIGACDHTLTQCP